MSEYFGLGSPPPDLNKMQAEIERLRGIAFGAEEYALTVRRATVEECARVVLESDDGWFADSLPGTRDAIVAAIRALKDNHA